MRDDLFLNEELEKIWQSNFSDVERKNNVKIRFKGRWKNKFGHIKKLKNGDSEIVINGYFRNESVPDFILQLTIKLERKWVKNEWKNIAEREFREQRPRNIGLFRWL